MWEGNVQKYYRGMKSELQILFLGSFTYVGL